MSPTVRIDDEVWAWLEGLAQPLKDTPNSVLRRVAGLDDPANAKAGAISSFKARPGPLGQEGVMSTPATTRAPVGRRITGKHLNRRYRLAARHALYHKDGTFYERLTAFPGVLCDSRGFVRYDSESQFDRDSRLNIGRKVNVTGGLYSHPRYQRYPRD